MVVALVPHERVQQRTAEQFVDVPQIQNVDVVRLVPQERVQWPDEQMVEVPIPQITKDDAEVFPERICV